MAKAETTGRQCSDRILISVFQKARNETFRGTRARIGGDDDIKLQGGIEDSTVASRIGLGVPNRVTCIYVGFATVVDPLYAMSVINGKANTLFISFLGFRSTSLRLPVGGLDYSQSSSALEKKEMTFRPLFRLPLYILMQIHQPATRPSFPPRPFIPFPSCKYPSSSRPQCTLRDPIAA